MHTLLKGTAFSEHLGILAGILPRNNNNNNNAMQYGMQCTALLLQALRIWEAYQNLNRNILSVHFERKGGTYELSTLNPLKHLLFFAHPPMNPAGMNVWHKTTQLACSHPSSPKPPQRESHTPFSWPAAMVGRWSRCSTGGGDSPEQRHRCQSRPPAPLLSHRPVP